MNIAITLARKGKTYEILITPEVSYSEQRRNFRNLRAGLEGYDEVELWSSGQGRVKRHRFKSKVVAPPVPVPVIVPDVAPTSEVPESPPVVAPSTKRTPKPKAAAPKKPGAKKKK